MKTITPLTTTTHALMALWLVSASWSAWPTPISDPELEKVIQHGKELFTHNTFEGNGRVCQTCHLGGGTEPGRLPDGKVIPSLANAAAVFPRFKPNQGKVFTLADQIRSCAGAALQGKAPAHGSDELNALVTYVTSLSQGKPIDMGGKPQ